MADFRMPSLGADMTEGTLLHWAVHPGDAVHSGDIVAEVDTAKAAIEVECFDDGVIGQILVPQGQTVPVGTALATIEPAAAPVAVPDSGPSESPVVSGQTAGRAAESAAPPVPLHAEIPAHEVRATPLVRRLADQAGLDLSALHGSGPNGRIVRADVESAVSHEADLEHGVKQRDTSPKETADGDGAARRRRQGKGKGQPRRERSANMAPGSRGHRRTAGRPTDKREPSVADVVRQPADAPDRAAPTPSRAGTQRHTRPAGNGPATVKGVTAAPEYVRASGYARRLATELRVDIVAVPGTGPGGAVRAADIRAARSRRQPSESVGRTARPEPQMPSPESVPTATAIPARDITAMRTQIAAAMSKSKQTVPHYYLSSVIDVAPALDRLHDRNLTLPVSDRILLPALLFRAVAVAARRNPEVNGHWGDGKFRPAATVHLGVVVSLRGGGIILPTIPDADTLDPPAMMAALRGLVSRARAARLRSADITPATITVTNLGDLGVDSVFGVIAVPQVAIVGLGAVTERPCAVDGLLGVRPQLTATLSADHRVSDGASGARFLETVSELLQHPEEL